ncbi:MAG: acyltransferase family protein [Pseudomonadota bacterium]
MNLKYRPEIDGLRAIAVLPVILFHAGFSTFSGGFVGVDVFFVISGFLITSIIVKDVEAGTFSFWDFYERRARRILPALFLVMLCCIPFAWMWMLPMELKAFSTSVVSVCLFVTNVLFWRQSGYFDAAAELKPLLHTWSLAVEEQFYIIFPIAILLLWRFGRRNVISSIALVVILSLALSQYASNHYPSANFYLLPTRAWELMAGALCSFAIVGHSIPRDNILSLAGLAAIVVSVFAYDETIPFPSLYALLPVLGTCAILLFARQGTLVGALLSMKPVVGIGLISYSAYLWHQPLFAFARIRSLTEPTSQLMLLLAVASIALAYLSWRFVEVPARRRGAWPLPSRRTAFATLGVVAAAFITAGMAGHFTKGFPTRLSAEQMELEQRVAVNHGLSEDCEGDFNLSPHCRTSDTPEVILWGDSFAMHLLDGVRASNPNLSIVQLTSSVCGPFIGIAPTSADYPISWANKCLHFNDQVLDFIKRTKSVKYAVLSSPFGQFVGDGSLVLTSEQKVVVGSTVAVDTFRRTLETLISLGIKPIVFSPPPSPGFDAGKCLVNAQRFNEDRRTCDFNFEQAAARQKAVRDFLTEIAKDYRVIWLDPAICDGDNCAAGKDGVFIYRDGGHLSHEGSAYIGRKMDFYGLITDQKP